MWEQYHQMPYRIRPPQLLQDGGGPYIHCPITGERHRIHHTGVSQKQIVNLIMDRYPEPPKDTESKEPDPPKQLSIAPTAMLPPLTRVPVPSYPITQAHLLGLSAQDHDLIKRNLEEHIRRRIADALPGHHAPEEVDGAGARGPPWWLEDDRTPERVRYYIEDLVRLYDLEDPEFSNRTGLARLNQIPDGITEQHGFGSGGRSGRDLDRVGHMRVPVVAADEVGTLR
jgi:hypothetical protein